MGVGSFTGPPPPTHPNRRGWLIAFGVVELLIAAFFVLMAAVMAIVIPRTPTPGNSVPVSSGFFVGIAIFYTCIAALFAACGIGSILAKNWARITMLVAGWIWLAFGVLTTLISALVLPMSLRESQRIMQQQNPAAAANLGPGFESFALAIAFVFMVLMWVVLPAIMVFFYSRPSVRATCMATAAPNGTMALPVRATAPGVPVLNVVLAVWFGLSALSLLITLLWLPAATLFGEVLRGAPAQLVYATYGLLNAFCAWAFVKRDLRGWWVAVVSHSFWIASGLVTFMRLSTEELIKISGVPMDDRGWSLYRVNPGLLTVLMFMGVAISLVGLGLIVYSRRNFPR